MSSIALKYWYKPSLALGVYTFQSNRLATYESMLGFIEKGGSATTPRVQEIFENWAARDRKRMETRHLVFSAIATRISRGGVSVAQAMRPFISSQEYLILAAGETNDDLPKALQLIIRNIQASSGMLESIFNALAQPAMGLSMVVLLSFFFGAILWPDLLRAIPPKFWPAWTLPCINAQIWFAKNWYTFLSFFVLVAIYYRTRDRWTGKSRDFFDKLPPWSIHKGEQAASFLGVIASLIEAGRTVRESLVDIRDKSDPYMRWQVSRIIARYDTSGKDAMSSLRTGLFNTMILDRIEDASTGRDFGATLAYTGNTALKVVMRIVNTQAQSAGLALTALIGLAFFYIAAVTTFGIQEATDGLLKGMQGVGGISM